MNQLDFIEIFKASFEELDATISLDTTFRDLEEWTSMQALLLIAEIDDQLEVVLDADDIKNATTVLDLYNIVKAKS